MNFNVNSAECIKEYQKLGETVYRNICTGQEMTIPWGIDGWFVGSIVVCLIVLLVIFITMMFKDY